MQVTTFSFFHFDRVPARLWAFAQMGLAPRRLRGTEGLQFCKLLGTGGENGFSAKPDFSTYSLLAVWDDEAKAQQFFDGHPVFRAYCRQSVAGKTYFLHNTLAHGLWDGQQPFVAATAFDPAAPVAVLTRATIRTRYLFHFWRQVPPVSRSMADKPGLRFAKGVGELPWIQQATFSIWDSGQHMMQYAYQSPLHREVIRQTRELGWYKEELFARFVPFREVGHEPSALHMR
jgi:hypothetical protein